MPPSVDQQARDDVRDVQHKLNGHMQTTEIHLKNLETSMATNHKAMADKVEDIRKAILWAGGIVISVMLSVLGWAVLQQINANEAQKQGMEDQIRILQESERARALQERNDELTSSAAEASGVTVSRGERLDFLEDRTEDGSDDELADPFPFLDMVGRPPYAR